MPSQWKQNINNKNKPSSPKRQKDFKTRLYRLCINKINFIYLIAKVKNIKRSLCFGNVLAGYGLDSNTIIQVVMNQFKPNLTLRIH